MTTSFIERICWKSTQYFFYKDWHLKVLYYSCIDLSFMCSFKVWVLFKWDYTKLIYLMKWYFEFLFFWGRIFFFPWIRCGKNKQHSSDKSDKRANVRVLNENLILTSSLEIIGGNLQQNLTSSYESLLASLLALRHLLLQLEVALKIICSLYPSCFLYYLVKFHQNVYYNLLMNTE